MVARSTAATQDNNDIDDLEMLSVPWPLSQPQPATSSQTARTSMRSCVFPRQQCPAIGPQLRCQIDATSGAKPQPVPQHGNAKQQAGLTWQKGSLHKDMHLWLVSLCSALRRCKSLVWQSEKARFAPGTAYQIHHPDAPLVI